MSVTYRDLGIVRVFFYVAETVPTRSITVAHGVAVFVVIRVVILPRAPAPAVTVLSVGDAVVQGNVVVGSGWDSDEKPEIE